MRYNYDDGHTKIMPSAKNISAKKETNFTSKSSAELKERKVVKNQSGVNRPTGFRPVSETQQFATPKRAAQQSKASKMPDREKHDERKAEPKPSIKRQTERNRKGHIPSRFTGLLLAIILLISVASLICFSILSTKITNIYVIDEDNGFNDFILSSCEKLKGKSYLLTSTKAVETEILKKSPLIKDIKFLGKFPRKLEISVIYDNPDYYTVANDIVYTLNSDLKVLGRSDINEETSLLEASLTKLLLPEFKEPKSGEFLEFTSNDAYIKRVCSALCSYTSLGEISFINLTNTQGIYFIFDTNYRCDLGDSGDLDAKLISAENIYEKKILPIKSTTPNRTAIINVSTPASASIRTDVDLGMTE